MTEKDVKLFKSLHQGQTGRDLVDYLERLQSELCDIRLLQGKEIEKEVIARTLASRIIQDSIISKIKVQSEPRDISKNTYA